MLSKLGSQLNKPNRQTVILVSQIPALMENARIKKTRNCGGKIAKRFEELGIEKMGELLQFSASQLGQMLEDEERGEWLYQRCRGICHQELREHIKNPSMLAVKSFKEIKSSDQIRGIIDLLTKDVQTRAIEHFKSEKEHPHSYAIHFPESNFKLIAKRYPLNLAPEVLHSSYVSQDLKSQKHLTEKVLEKVKQNEKEIFPTILLGVSLKEFRLHTDKSLIEFYSKQEKDPERIKTELQKYKVKIKKEQEKKKEEDKMEQRTASSHSLKKKRVSKKPSESKSKRISDFFK